MVQTIINYTFGNCFYHQLKLWFGGWFSIVLTLTTLLTNWIMCSNMNPDMKFHPLVDHQFPIHSKVMFSLMLQTLPSGNLLHSYRKHGHRKSEFSHNKLWFSIVMLTFTRGYIHKKHIKKPFRSPRRESHKISHLQGGAPTSRLGWLHVKCSYYSLPY